MTFANPSAFNQKPMPLQFLWLVLICLICFGLAQSFTAVMLNVMGVDLQSMASGEIDHSAVNAVRFAQIFMTAGAFLVPGLVFSYMKRGDLSYVGMKLPLILAGILLAGAIAVISFPFLAFTKQINDLLVLPEALAGLEAMMKASEKQAEELVKSMLRMDNIGELMLTLVTTAVMPALAEEVLFRGAIQKMLHEWTKRPHLAIWLTGALFSFIHFQFYGFLPRWFIGILLGYLFYWSGNLWYPIIGHFVNNGAQVLAAYMYDAELLQTDIETVEQVPFPAVVVSVIGFVLLASMFYKQFKGPDKPSELLAEE